MVKKNLWRIASHLLLLLLAAVLVVPLSGPVRAQEAGQTLTLDMVPVGIEGEISGAVSLRIPPGYELSKTGQDDISWGKERVSTKHYTYGGTKVFSVIIFPDGSEHSALGEQADGIDLGGGILFIRGPVDIQAEAQQNLRPHVEGTIYEEGAITVPGNGASYPGYYYLSTSTKEETSIISQAGKKIEYRWTTVNHHLQLRVVLTQSQPLYTVTLWASTWGLPDGIHSDGSRGTYTIDGKPQFVRHKEYLKDILASISISGLKAPSPAPTTPPAPTTVPAPTPSEEETPSPPQVSTPPTGETPIPQESITYPPATSAELDRISSDYPRVIIYFLSRVEYEKGELEEVPEEARHIGLYYGRSATFKTVLEGENRYWLDRIRLDVWWIYYLQDELERLARTLEGLHETVARYPESGNRYLIPVYEQLIRDTITLLEKRNEMLAESIAEAEAWGCSVTAVMKNWVMRLKYHPRSIWSKSNIPKAGSTVQRREELTPEQQQEKIRTEYKHTVAAVTLKRQQLARARKLAQWNLGHSQKLTKNIEGFRKDVTQELYRFARMAVGNVATAAGERLEYLEETGAIKKGGKFINDLQSAAQLGEGVIIDLVRNKDVKAAELKVLYAAEKTFLEKGKGSEIFRAGAKKGLVWASLALDSVYTLLSVDTYDQIGVSLDRQVEGYDFLVRKTDWEVKDLVREINELEEKKIQLQQQMRQ